MSNASSPDSAEVAERRIGEVIAGKWKLERVLGVGGMAAVYAATHTNNLRPAALKLLHPELAANADLRRRFLREGYFANKVGHPGAVAVLDDGVEGGAVFLVMELLTGESLAARRDRAPETLTVAEVLRIADVLLDVLAAAHAEGIVHRDLKPDNVFLGEDGAVKVLDFGIARLLDPPSGEESTKTGVLMGTPQYMPPEQARGRASLVDERSDLFSVGAILYTLLTGEHVHEADTANESLLRAMTTPATPLASKLPGVNPRVAAVVDRALEFEPVDRWQDARAMQAAVREALARLRVGSASSLALAPTQLSAAPALLKGVGAVTKAPTPVVHDVWQPSSNGGRLALVILSLIVGAAGAWSLAGSPLLARLSAGGGASGLGSPPAPQVPAASSRAPAATSRDLTAAPVASDAGGEPVGAAGSSAQSPVEAAPLDGGIDAAEANADGGAEADGDEDDDGGADEDDDLPMDAGRGGVGGAALVRQPAHAAHKAAAPVVHKGKRSKKRKKKN